MVRDLCTIISLGTVWLRILRAGGSRLSHPVAAILFWTARRLVGERHDGSTGVGCCVLRVLSGEAAQIFAGGINGAVDGAFIGLGAVFLSLVQVVRDSCF